MNQNDAGKQSHQLLNHPRPPPSIPPPSCPRCSSERTKFCYYNNYSVSQPRYFCKDCRRYWTHGGALRNIPSGGSSRKRGRVDVASSSSQILKPTSSRNLLPSPPPPLAWSLGSSSNNPSSGAVVSSSIGRGTFRPPITETMQYFNGGGYFNQTSYKFSPGGNQLGGVNTAFGAVSMGFGGGAPPPPPVPSTPSLPQISPLDNFHDFGFPVLQRPPQHPPPPPPPTVWTSQNMGFNNARTTFIGSNNFHPVARDLTAAAHVVSIDEWSELNDMDNEGDPFQSYKPPSP